MRRKAFHTKPKTTRPSKSRKKKFGNPQTIAEFFAMPEKDRELLTTTGHTLTRLREEDISLSSAMKQTGLTRRQFMRIAGKYVRKKNGRYVAKAYDRLLRVLMIPTPEGLHEIALQDSREATILGKYWAAVERYLETGDASALRKFDGMFITDSDGKQVDLLTELEALDRLGSAGVLSFESIYARVA